MHTRSSGRTVSIVAIACALALVVFWLTATSSSPLAPQQATPTAADVGAGRDAYQQLTTAKGNQAGSWVQLGNAQLTGLSALASHGFRPDRLDLAIDGSELRAVGSHHLPMGRWLNVTLRMKGPSSGFPRTHLKVGVWTLPPFLSRMGLQAARWILHLRHTDLPPLDNMVRHFSVEHGQVRALVSTAVIDEVAGAVALPVDADQVLRVYCSLTSRQRREPSLDFAEQVRRAFSVDPEGTSRSTFNASAFVALGMLVVDDSVADFAHISAAELGRCRMAPVPVEIYNRADWPKHWALSAALAAGAGTQLSEAAGEWKELADSLSRQSQFAIGDPSGFSMADLAADRAGFETAQAAVRSNRAGQLASGLAHATSEQLLPHETIEREDGLTKAEFVRKYGGIDDARFHTRIKEIDAALNKSGLR